MNVINNYTKAKKEVDKTLPMEEEYMYETTQSNKKEINIVMDNLPYEFKKMIKTIKTTCGNVHVIYFIIMKECQKLYGLLIEEYVKRLYLYKPENNNHDTLVINGNGYLGYQIFVIYKETKNVKIVRHLQTKKTLHNWNTKD